jgi:hypothetical protein
MNSGTAWGQSRYIAAMNVGVQASGTPKKQLNDRLLSALR